MSDIETKNKIIHAAGVLFADYGYEGTSVRDIAKAAGVNAASLNYYFSSKENLFLEIMKSAFMECAYEMKARLEKNQGNLEETMIDFFHYFLDNSQNLRSHFKMMLSAVHSHHLMTRDTEDSIYGPPGGMVVAEVLRKISPSSPDCDIYWALRTLFGHVVHTALIHTTCLKSNTEVLFSKQSDLEQGIRRLTRMVLMELKNPQHSASSL